jgi:hypothetical protein
VNEAVEDFRRLAAEYCALVEQPPRIVELQEALLTSSRVCTWPGQRCLW